MSNLNLTEVSRREPYLAGSPQFTPWEENSKHPVIHDGNGTVTDRPRDSDIPTRPSRRQIVFFLQPTGVDGKWGDWFAAAFLEGKVLFRGNRDYPKGILTHADQRRNIAIPPSVSYGDYVGEDDGIAAYGLDSEDYT